MFSTRIRSNDTRINDLSTVNNTIFNRYVDQTQTMPANPHLAQFGLFSPVTRLMPVSQMIDFESSMLGLNNKIGQNTKANIPPNCYKSNKGMYCDNMRQSYVLN